MKRKLLYFQIRPQFWNNSPNNEWGGGFQKNFTILLLTISRNVTLFSTLTYDVFELMNPLVLCNITFAKKRSGVNSSNAQGHPTAIFGKISVRKTI